MCKCNLRESMKGMQTDSNQGPVILEVMFAKRGHDSAAMTARKVQRLGTRIGNVQ